MDYLEELAERVHRVVVLSIPTVHTLAHTGKQVGMWAVKQHSQAGSDLILEAAYATRVASYGQNDFVKTFLCMLFTGPNAAACLPLPKYVHEGMGFEAEQHTNRIS